MKTIATFTFGAGAVLCAYATGALAQDHKKVDPLDPSPSVLTAEPTWNDVNSQGFHVIVDEVDAKTPRQPTTPPAAPDASNREDVRTVRMVVEATNDDHDETTGMCIFVPAGDEAAGALSCPGGNVRIVEFGDGHDRQFLVGDEVIDDEEIRALVEARIAEVNAHLAERDAWEVEIVEYFNDEEFQREMSELQREMETLSQQLHFEYQSGGNMTPEERAEFQESMAEFQEEMMEMQADVMAEAAAAMAELRAEGIPVTPMPPHSDMSWFGGSAHTGRVDRQVIRVERDGEQHVTIIEHSDDDDGNPRLVIRTTDPNSVEVVRIDADELDDD